MKSEPKDKALPAEGAGVLEPEVLSIVESGDDESGDYQSADHEWGDDELGDDGAKERELEFEEPVELADAEILSPSFESGGFAHAEVASSVDASSFELPEVVPKKSPRRSKSGSKDLVQYDPLRSYLAEIQHLPTLTREQEHELALQFAKGDKAAGYQLVMANLRLVVLIAREYQRNVQNILDLVQEGNIGLLEAVKKFDPFRGIRFPSYAVYWIRAYMLRYLINNVRLVKIGTTQAQRKLFFNLMKEKDKLEREGFSPEARLLAERLSVKESEVIEMEQRLALPEVSVDQPMIRGEDSVDLHGVLPDTSDSAEQIVVREQYQETLRQALEQFKASADDKERAIIEQRLFTEDPVTLQLIADQFGVSRERIRQIEERVKKKLKVYLSERLEVGAP